MKRIWGWVFLALPVLCLMSVSVWLFILSIRFDRATQTPELPSKKPAVESKDREATISSSGLVTVSEDVLMMMRMDRDVSAWDDKARAINFAFKKGGVDQNRGRLFIRDGKLTFEGDRAYAAKRFATFVSVQMWSNDGHQQLVALPARITLWRNWSVSLGERHLLYRGDWDVSAQEMVEEALDEEKPWRW